MKTAPLIPPDPATFNTYIRHRQKPSADRGHLKTMGGLTLVELAVVLFILVGLAGVTIPMFTGTARYSECVATDTTLANIRDAIMGGGVQGGYRSDMGGVPRFDNNLSQPSATASNLNDLFNNPLYIDYSSPGYTGYSNPTFNQPFNAPTTTNPTTTSFNPTTQRGWRGPYISGGITCSAILDKLNKLLPLGSTIWPANIDGQGICGFTGTSPLITSTNPYYTFALDSYPVIETNPDGSTTFLLQGSPIALMADVNSKYFLVSGGPTNGIEVTSSSVTSRTNIDDRVLYLDAVDQSSNQPCS